MNRPTNAQRLGRLQAITDAALAHLELDDLLGELLTRIRDALEADTTAILLLDDDRRELVARAAVGLEEEVDAGIRIPLGRGFAGRVASERRPIIVEDVDHAEVLNPILREKGVKSLLGVPLLVEGAPRGVLHAGSLTPRTFTREEIDLLQLAADRAAIAIDRARLYEAERTARQRLEHVQQVTDAALTHLDLDELMLELLTRIRGILGADTAAVLLLDEERDELAARAAVGIEEEVEQGVRIPLGRGFAGRVAAEVRPIVIPDVDTADIYNPILREKGIKSLLGVPLIVNGRTLGVLHVGTLTPRVFTAADVELLELVAARCALAIERARLHQEVVEFDQMKLNFVAIASHELRTPAAAVYGALTTLVGRGDQLDAETREQLLRTGWEQSERLRRLLEQLLDLSRLDAAAVQVQPEPLVLHALVSEVAETVERGDGGRVDVHVPPDLAVVADRLVLDRVLSNLLVNAFRHGAPPVVVAAEQRDRHLRVTVSDAGAGVPEEVQPQLFDRFARGSEGAGSGLGLAIAKAYAQAHGGDLLYDAAEGSEFTLILPVG